jgi:hypothetical protein
MGECDARSGQASAKARFLEQAPRIEAVDARSAGQLGFRPRIFVQATLPHSRPTVNQFERVNGRDSLHLTAPPSIGLPFGSYPRLVLAWLTTEAVRTKTPEIRLGPPFSEFTYRLGLTPVTGKRGTVPRLRDQLHRLLRIGRSYAAIPGDQVPGPGRGGVPVRPRSRRRPGVRAGWSAGVGSCGRVARVEAHGIARASRADCGLSSRRHAHRYRARAEGRLTARRLRRRELSARARAAEGLGAPRCRRVSGARGPS